MQKYSGSEYELKVSRCKKEDAGTYLVIAENSFGKREEKASLKVERKIFTYCVAAKSSQFDFIVPIFFIAYKYSVLWRGFVKFKYVYIDWRE